MIDTAEVFMWGVRIGIIHMEANTGFVSFEYDKYFRTSGIEISPFYMPLSDKVYSFPQLEGNAFHGAPGLLADSLPDKFGNSVIIKWLTKQNKKIDEFNVIDRLCYTGKRGMGALEYEPVSGPEFLKEENINIDKMVEFASEVLSSRSDKEFKEDDIGYSQLLQLGTSAGGARAKALIAWNEEKGIIKSGQIDAGKGYEYWLMKFDGVKKNGDHNLEDSPEYTKIEYAYYLMALEAGINMNECRLYEDNNMYHFMTKRFDREGNQKIHMQTLGALAHIDYNTPGLCSYEQAVYFMRELKLKASEIEEFFKRMVFNVLFVNQDDHVKNVSFLMNKKGEWKLSPAYDLTFSYNPDNRWLKAHQMLINNKSEHITRQDLLTAGKNMGVPTRKCNVIIDNIIGISNNTQKYFEKVGIREKTYQKNNSIIDEQRKDF